MANTRIINGLINGLANNASATNYWCVGETTLAFSTTETNCQTPWRTAGTFSTMHTRVVTNTSTAASTIFLRKNGTNINQTISIGSAATGTFADLANTDVITAGDKMSYRITVGAGGQIVIGHISDNFAATSNTVMKYLCSGNNSYNQASTNEFFTIAGNTSVGETTTETNAQFKIKTTGTLNDLFLFCGGNARTTATTFNSRINGTTGNLAISVGSAASGIFEDTTNSDVVASGSLVNYLMLQGTGTGLFTIRQLGVEFTTTNNANHHIASHAATNDAINASSTATFLPGGDAQAGGTAGAGDYAGFVHSANNMEIFITGNITNGATMSFLKNGTAGNQSVAIGSGLTGYFEDTTNSDSVAATDEIAYKVVTGAGGGPITFWNMGYLFTSPSGVTLLPLLGCG